MKKKNIISLIISLIVVFNMVFCVSATGSVYGDVDTSYGTSDSSAGSVDAFSADTDGLNQGLDENPMYSLFTDGNTAGADSTTNALMGELEDLSPVTPGNAGATGTIGKKIDLKTILIIVAAVAAVAIAAVVVFIVIKKKKSSDDEENASQIVAPEAVMKFDIPVGNTGAIRYEYRFEGSASAGDVPFATHAQQFGEVPVQASFGAASVSEPVVKIDNTRDIIMSIYKGEAPVEAFTGTVVPLVLTNIYDLQISESIQPVFARGNDLHSSDYILVNDKYLYLNYHTFNKGEFKLYADIVAVEKCFNIVNRMGAVASPGNQAIFDFEPAVFEISGTDFVVSEKGKITIE